MIQYKNKLEKWTIRIAVALVIGYLVVGSVVVLAHDSEQHQIIQSYKTFENTFSGVCKTDGRLKLYERWPITVTENMLTGTDDLQEILFVSIVKPLDRQNLQEWYFVKDKKGAFVEWVHDDYDLFLNVVSTDFYRFAHGQPNGCKKLTYV